MKLAKRAQLQEKIVGLVPLDHPSNAMMSGVKLNITENRAVLHTALRAKEDEHIFVDGHDVVPDVYAVRRHIKEFSEAVRSGKLVVCVFIPISL